MALCHFVECMLAESAEDCFTELFWVWYLVICDLVGSEWAYAYSMNLKMFR